MYCCLRTGLSCVLALGMFLSVSISTGARAQEGSAGRLEGLALSGDQPIQIESDKLQVQDEKGTAIFSGNVKVVQGKTTMQSGHMTVYYAKEEGASTTGSSKIDRIDVKDKVYIKSENQEATADRGVFDMISETVELTGERVVLSEGENVFVGCKLTVFVKSGEAKLEACGKRVKIQLDPKSRKK
ncbi:LptA/OstA family protein [Hoeflea sp. TYP-13]|uniref:LptA/OstA family protein n=1 Tax=Hoeflea sp. TYP-13 TaxID=3230023 RepID=UPI0034C6BF09